MKEKVTVKWSKREKDWVSKWPEWENRNAKILGNNFFGMIREYEEWSGKKIRNIISEAGFDPDTFTISVKAKSRQQGENNMGRYKNKTLKMPRELTAENGAKALLIGEFHETIYLDNPDYCGCDDDMCECREYDEPETIPQKIIIEWSTIKEIYKMAVEHLGR